MAMSIRVPDDVKQRIEKLAAAEGTSAHAFMLSAIRDRVEAEEARAAFHAEARRRLAKMKKSGHGLPADEVFEYLERRADGHSPPRPKARRLA